MTVVRSGKAADQDKDAGVDGERRETVRREDMPRSQHETAGELGANNLNVLIQRVAGTSMQEIDTLIHELQSVRDVLRAEGERVQREIAGYAQLSQAASKSTKVIADSVDQWKTAVGDGRKIR